MPSNSEIEWEVIENMIIVGTAVNHLIHAEDAPTHHMDGIVIVM